MLAFLGWVGHYLIVGIALAVFAALGITVGIKLRKNKDAKDKLMAESAGQTVEEK